MRQTFFFVFFTLTSLICSSQSGTITYKNTLEPPSKLEDLKKKDPEKYRRYSMMINQMAEAEKQANYMLNFNSKMAVFSEEKSMSKKNKMLPRPKEHTLYYYELENNQRAYQTERSGKYFRVIEDPIDWKIIDEEKIIDNYKCKKAIATQIFYSYDREGKLKTKEQAIECWFTSQIPVPFGPENYGGLPGLILSLSSQGNNYIVSEICLEKESKNVKEPTKGVLLDEKEFALEMHKMFNNYSGN